ncbi:short chain dehydrogenase [Paenibacillus algorifonticola]|uniref:Short chain dehydrogenase n=1 Tax=Paenibacillus algorifonticola TaxID=684063 RepID=A0A1I2E4L7_9BACL|nr:SDR family NAD(P)-dependent oxidoreductase [Paenibacillus algorifonticola]SFE87603.1 short chain dehydrogenase [Paenibacillus algorifonticola]
MGYALVTGADRGLGLGFVRQLLLKGFTVFAGRYASDWQGLPELKQQFDERLHIIELNVAEDASVKEAARLVAIHTDRLNIVYC